MKKKHKKICLNKIKIILIKLKLTLKNKDNYEFLNELVDCVLFIIEEDPGSLNKYRDFFLIIETSLLQILISNID